MAETWKKKALEIGDIIRNAAREHVELAPLYTSFSNFARKHQAHRQQDDTAALQALLERHGLTIMPKRDVDRFQTTISSQAEEIKALEYRITTFLRPE